MVDTKEFITPELLESINDVAEVSGFTEFNDALNVIKADLNQVGVDWSNPSTSQSGWQNLIKGIKDMLTMQSILAGHVKNFDTAQLIANLTTLTGSPKPNQRSFQSAMSDSKAYISFPVFKDKKHETKLGWTS